MNDKQNKKLKFVVCVTDLEPDLELRKIYRVIPDEAAEKKNYLRILDESGEDYLYPSNYFSKVEVQKDAEQRLFYNIPQI